jgi:hypothetical protein
VPIGRLRPGGVPGSASWPGLNISLYNLTCGQPYKCSAILSLLFPGNRDMFERFLSLPNEVYQAQMDLSARGLIAEFVTVFIITFLIGIYRCTDRASVNWKRTDYFYFGTTVLAAAIGIAEFTASGWTREVQNLQMERATTIERLCSGARWIDGLCDRQYDSDLSRKDRNHDGVLAPLDPQWFKPSFPEPWLFNNECEIAKLIAFSFDETMLNMVVGKIRKITSHTVVSSLPSGIESYDPFKDRDLAKSYSNLETGEFFLQRPAPPGYRFNELILNPAHMIVDVNAKIELIENEVRSLSSTNIFRHLYPILFGLGLGVRLARTHYDVKMAQKDEITKRFQATKPLELLSEQGNVFKEQTSSSSPMASKTLA